MISIRRDEDTGKCRAQSFRTFLINDPAAVLQSFSQRKRVMNGLERIVQNCGIDARVCEIVNEKTAIVSGATYADFLFARSILERQGWRVIKPAAESAKF